MIPCRLGLSAALALGLFIAPAQARNDRPPQCPQTRWCGCWLADYLGKHDKRLWKASEWLKEGRRVLFPMPGAIAVYPHHVGIVTGVPRPGEIIMKSGNDNRAVRERPRSTRGVIAYVIP